MDHFAFISVTCERRVMTITISLAAIGGGALQRLARQHMYAATVIDALQW
ncbi:MAG: hypothetical protein ACKVQT_20620 [Burkholderiales bacterium]